jgi:catechol 2,3-dioxygenase-like lactoylglutathione lyase family enzyme
MTPTGHPAPAWFDISSPDAPRARRFYREMFGWPVNLLDETYALVGDEGGQPAGGIGQAGPDSPYTGIVDLAALGGQQQRHAIGGEHRGGQRHHSAARRPDRSPANRLRRPAA